MIKRNRRSKPFEFEHEGACIKCISHKYDQVGYMRIAIKDVLYNLHKIIYEHTHGKLQDDHVVHHLCENRGCLNPTHLVAMSVSDHWRHHRKSMDTSKNNPWGVKGMRG